MRKYFKIFCFVFLFISYYTNGQCTISVLDSQNVSCYNGNDGYITVSGSGGAGVYHYSLQIYNYTFGYWQQIGQSPLGFNFTYSNVTFPQLYANCYQIVMTDPLGCSDTASICLTEPDQIQVFSTVTSSSSNSINDGSIIIDSITGGIPPYIFSWIGPNGFTSSSQNITNLQNGTYTLNLTDSNSCLISLTFIVEALIPGCTDSLASNYDLLANIDDSTCCYIQITQEDTTICQGDVIILDLDLFSSSYLWSTSDTTSSITISPYISTFYWVITDNSCYNSVLITVNLVDTNTTSVTSCDSYLWLGNTYSTTGLYDSLFTNIDGCDSLTILDLTITNSDTTTTVLLLLVILIFGMEQTYTTSGVYDSLFTQY